MENIKNKVYDAFKIICGLFLLYYSVIMGMSIASASNKIVFAVYVLLVFATSILILIKELTKTEKISGILLIFLMLALLLFQNFLNAILMSLNTTSESMYGFIIITIVYMFRYKTPRKSKGGLTIIFAVVFFLLVVINSVKHIAAFVLEILKYNNELTTPNVTVFHILSFIIGISVLGEGIYVLINALGKAFDKNTYKTMFIWCGVNFILSRIIISTGITEITLYSLFSYLKIIDTYLVYIDFTVLRYFFYLLFIYSSLNFYKKEKPQKIEE